MVEGREDLQHLLTLMTAEGAKNYKRWSLKQLIPCLYKVELLRHLDGCCNAWAEDLGGMSSSVPISSLSLRFTN